MVHKLKELYDTDSHIQRLLSSKPQKVARADVKATVAEARVNVLWYGYVMALGRLQPAFR